jgi:transposase
MTLPLHKETRRHSDAYAYYLQLGGKRSYAKVAHKFGISETSVRKWAQSFAWEKRVDAADNKANANQRKNTQEEYIHTVEDFKNLKGRILFEAKKRVESDQCSISDLVSIWKMVRIELGEPTTIAQSSIRTNMTDHNPFADIYEAVFGENGCELAFKSNQ